MHGLLRDVALTTYLIAFHYIIYLKLLTNEPVLTVPLIVIRRILKKLCQKQLIMSGSICEVNDKCWGHSVTQGRQFISQVVCTKLKLNFDS